MKSSKKVIISCAVTGSIHTPSMSEHLPISPEEIASQAIAASKAGASILHLHARNPDGSPSPDPSIFREFLPEIKRECDSVINITTGAGLGMTMDQRLEAAEGLAPEVASMNMGSLNFNISGAVNAVSEFKHAWERPYLENTKDFILTNTFAQIEEGIERLSKNGTRFEFECYDIGHLYNLAHFRDRGLIKGPLFIQGIFGILGGMGADPENLMHFKATADRLFGDDYYLSTLAAGRHQMRFVTLSALLGGHVRVGLEDSLYLAKGKFAENNAQQVSKIKGILEELSLEIATPDEAREMLSLKGPHSDNID
jgi:3,5-dioxohexanoate:acetyl-CoA acetone transferase